MAIELPKTHYSLIEAFNLIGKAEYGEAWTGEDAADAEEKLGSTNFYAPQALWDALERYNGTLEKFKQVMALGISAEQLFDNGWEHLKAYSWEKQDFEISVTRGEVSVGDDISLFRKVRIDKAAFDNFLKEGPEALLTEEVTPTVPVGSPTGHTVKVETPTGGAKRGPPARYKWDDVLIEAARLVYIEGYRPQTQAELIRKLQDWYLETFTKEAPSDESFKPKIRKFWDALNLGDN